MAMKDDSMELTLSQADDGLQLTARLPASNVAVARDVHGVELARGSVIVIPAVVGRTVILSSN